MFVNASHGEKPIVVEIRDLGGKLLMRRKLSSGTMDIGAMRRNGVLLITCKVGDRKESVRAIAQ